MCVYISQERSTDSITFLRGSQEVRSHDIGQSFLRAEAYFASSSMASRLVQSMRLTECAWVMNE